MIFAVWLKIAYSRPFGAVLGGFDPLNGEHHLRDPQKAHPYTKRRHFDVLSVKIGATVSALACRKNPRTKKEAE